MFSSTGHLKPSCRPDVKDFQASFTNLGIMNRITKYSENIKNTIYEKNLEKAFVENNV